MLRGKALLGCWVGWIMLGQAAWAQSGACCTDTNDDGLPDSCGVLPQDRCTGTYLGDDTVCIGTGACCYGIVGGACLEIDGTCCEMLVGTFLGTGTQCLGDNDGDTQDDACIEPAPQACCLPQAAVPCHDLLVNECLALDGTPLGFNSACSGFGACCMPDGGCRLLDDGCCTAAGGAFQGAGSDCADGCPGVGACCVDFDDGPLQYDACDITFETHCGGAFQGDGTVCTTEACCLPGGFCQDADPACCTASSGSPAGPGSMCATTDCGPFFGACCFDIDDGPLQYDSCTILEQFECELQGGVFQGDASTCTTAACCLPGGACQNADPECCIASGGVPSFDGSICGLAACDLGACCFDIDDGPLQYDACIVIPEEQCEPAGGIFQGQNTACDTQACCLPGSVCQDADRDCCTASGGLPQGPGSACADVDCGPFFGACCLDVDDGPIAYDTCTVLEQFECLLMDGIFGGDGTQCEMQACCFDGSCADLDPDCCVASGGIPHNGTCDTVPCVQPLGACCLDIDDGPLQYDTCSLTAPADCADQGGVFQGPGSMCDLAGCCLPGGGCQDADPQCCLASRGVPQFDTCDAIPVCPIVLEGACCLDGDDDGLLESCQVMPQPQCTAQGGNYNGHGTVCEGNRGACCFGITGGACVVTDGACCSNVAGEFLGAETRCLGDNNNNGSDDVCEALPCDEFPDCADLDADGVRDSNCVWWQCDEGTCVPRWIVFADMGGQFLACPPDGTSDNNDRNHALRCFANLDGNNNQPYPCEPDSPQAFNVDAGGPFGDCNPDGVCDGNDAFHALTEFEGANVCACPLNITPAPSPPETRATEVTLRLVPRQRRVQPGGSVEIDVFVMTPLADFRGYQLHFGIHGGTRGTLRVTDLAVLPRRDAALGQDTWVAYNRETAQVVVGLDTPGVAVDAGSYLATLTLRAPRKAAGRFIVDVLHDHTDASQRTYLFATPLRERLIIEHSEPAVIEIMRPRATK